MFYSIIMSILLTSFKKSSKFIDLPTPFEPYSVSRWQPSKYNYKSLDFLGAYDINGERLHLKGSSPDKYKSQLFEFYTKNWKSVDEWLKSLDNDIHIMLCCWCPYSESTKRQLKEYDSFICHTGLIGKIINKFRPDIDVYMDKDHIKLYKPFQPNRYRIIEL